MKHQQTHHSDSHCISISLSTWKAWYTHTCTQTHTLTCTVTYLHTLRGCISIFFLLRCFECNEELSTHCNKKALAQTLDFLQKHSAKSASGKLPLPSSSPSPPSQHLRADQYSLCGSLAPSAGSELHILSSSLLKL